MRNVLGAMITNNHTEAALRFFMIHQIILGSLFLTFITLHWSIFTFFNMFLQDGKIRY